MKNNPSHFFKWDQNMTTLKQMTLMRVIRQFALLNVVFATLMVSADAGTIVSWGTNMSGTQATASPTSGFGDTAGTEITSWTVIDAHNQNGDQIPHGPIILQFDFRSTNAATTIDNVIQQDFTGSLFLTDNTQTTILRSTDIAFTWNSIFRENRSPNESDWDRGYISNVTVSGETTGPLISSGGYGKNFDIIMDFSVLYPGIRTVNGIPSLTFIIASVDDGEIANVVSTTVPEPSTLSLVAVGAAAACFRLIRRF
jgi:PEP-CTERM motif